MKSTSPGSPLRQAEEFFQHQRFDDAADACQHYLKRNPQHQPTRALLARCHCEIAANLQRYGGALSAAEDRYRRALQADPTMAAAYNNLACLLVQMHRSVDALAVLQQGLKVQGRDGLLLENFVKISQSQGLLDQAAQALRKLASLFPSKTGLYQIREALLIEKILPDKHYPEQIRSEIRKRLAEIPANGTDIRNPQHFPSAYFLLSYHGICNKEIHKALADAYLRVAPSLTWVAPHTPRPTPDVTDNGKIKIGFASAFFHEHSIGNTSRGLIEKIDRAHFEVHVIRLGYSPRDPTAQAIDQVADQVTTVTDEDLQSARQAIGDLQLDILFFEDIGMEPMSYFLSFARLARIQLTSYGHPDTPGTPNLDYFLSCDNYEISGAQNHYNERLITIPQVGTLAYYHPPPAPEIVAKADLGLSDCKKIYLCPQTLFKLHPVMDDVFAAILAKDHEATIVLIDQANEPNLRAGLERRFVSHGDLPAERIRFIPSLPYKRFLGLLALADTVLDPITFNGQNTSLEAFAQGIPVVTLPGTLQRERHTYGMYLAMGLANLAATSLDDYVDRAVRIANDGSYRQHLTGMILEKKATLFQSEIFVASCEKIFTSLARPERATS